MTRPDRTPEAPVVIAGAGPAGLVAAITALLGLEDEVRAGQLDLGDARGLAHWPTAPPDPRAELAAAISGWVEGGLVSSGAGTGRWRRGRRP